MRRTSLGDVIRYVRLFAMSGTSPKSFTMRRTSLCEVSRYGSIYVLVRLTRAQASVLQLVGLLGAMSEIPGTSATYFQLHPPDVNTYVRCILVSGYANIFAAEHDLTLYEVEPSAGTLYEVVPSAGFLLPVGSVCRVLQFGLEPRSAMPLLILQAWDVPCYGADNSVLVMRSMMWMGIVRCLWIPRPFADALPVCRPVWMGLGAEQGSYQSGAEQRSASGSEQRT